MSDIVLTYENTMKDGAKIVNGQYLGWEDKKAIAKSMGYEYLLDGKLVMDLSDRQVGTVDDIGREEREELERLRGIDTRIKKAIEYCKVNPDPAGEICLKIFTEINGDPNA